MPEGWRGGPRRREGPWRSLFAAPIGAADAGGAPRSRQASVTVPACKRKRTGRCRREDRGPARAAAAAKCASPGLCCRARDRPVSPGGLGPRSGDAGPGGFRMDAARARDSDRPCSSSSVGARGPSLMLECDTISTMLR